MKKIGYGMLASVMIAVLAAGAFGGCAGDSSSSVSNQNNSVVESSDSAQGKENANESTESENTESVPLTKAEVESARKQALEGMSEKEIERLTEVIKAANLKMEQYYFVDDIFANLEDPDDLFWNVFTTKGKEVQIGWAVDQTPEEIQKICKKEHLTKEEFYKKYNATEVLYDVDHDVDDFISLISELKSTVQNEQLKDDLQKIADEAKQGANHHEMKRINQMFKMLHDMDYFLLRYGPDDFSQYADDLSFVSTYFGTLAIYQND